MATSSQPAPEIFEPADPPVIEVAPDEGRRMFDEAAGEWLGISGEEFLRRSDVGKYAALIESEDNRRTIDLYLLIPFARQDCSERDRSDRRSAGADFVQGP